MPVYSLSFKKNDFLALRDLVRANMDIAKKPLAEAIQLITFIAEQGNKLRRIEASRRILNAIRGK